MISSQQPVERPNGSFVKYTRTGFNGRPIVSIMVREDDPRNPDTPQRWRTVEGSSRWFAWEQLHATGTVEPLFTGTEVAAALAHRYGTADGRITGIGVAARDLYLAAGQNLGSLRPAIDGRPAHLWLETARQRWLDLAARGEAPRPGTQAALARSTLTGGATPTHTAGTSTITAAGSLHQAARPAPATLPNPGQAASTPPPARGMARVVHPAPRR